MFKEFSGYKSAITVQLSPSVRALPWPTCPPQHLVPSLTALGLCVSSGLSYSNTELIPILIPTALSC